MPNAYKIFALVLIAAFSLGGMAVIQPAMPAPDAANAPIVGAVYAAPVERVETHVLGRGQTLSSVLAQARITGQEMADVLLGLREHLNPNRIRDNAEITVRRWASTNEPRTVEVRVNRDSTIRLTRAPIGWDSEVIITPTFIDTVFAGGVIANGVSTLYEAIVFDEASRLPPGERISLVYELASIYEYKLDFTREIQRGDSYRVVYEREARPDGSARSKKIIAAEIVTQNQHHPAFWFEGSAEVRGYFDAEARPLAHGFSKYPVSYRRITSRFNPNRYHPVLGVYRAHAGTDFGAPSGADVQSVANGTVTFAGTNGGYGRMIEIRHFNGYTTRYAHLSRFAAGIRVGTRVTQKQLIGYVGATGLATAPHLHYELRKNGRAVDAMRERLPDAPPIPGALRTGFVAVAELGSSLLERIPAGTYYADTRGAPSATTRGADEL
ncbi:MAG TPA: M23 family metallopeptidase [Longimicrobiales bacterium]|nr:M23 family metallopeptidase [Longimicrobiales bacterium]